MAVTVNDPLWLDPHTVRLSWSSSLSDPTYYIYRDGVLIVETMVESMDFVLEAGEAFVVDVLDSASASPAAAFPGRLTLQWTGASDIKKYRIEEYVAAAWTARATVYETGRGYYTWRTRFLEDVTSHQFRIVPVGVNGNEGTPASFTCLMVRNPNPPDVTFAYSNATDKVTITAV